MDSCTIAGRVRWGEEGRRGQGGSGLHTHKRPRNRDVDVYLFIQAFIYPFQHPFIEKCLLIPYLVFLWVPDPGQG